VVIGVGVGRSDRILREPREVVAMGAGHRPRGAIIET
jgi:hypothetical protein